MQFEQSCFDWCTCMCHKISLVKNIWIQLCVMGFHWSNLCYGKCYWLSTIFFSNHGTHLDLHIIFIRLSQDGPYYVIGYGERVGVHTGFRTITLVLCIGSLPNLATWFLCGRGRTLFILGSLGQRSGSLTINRMFDNRVPSTR